MRESMKLLLVVMVCLLLVTACVPAVEEASSAAEVPVQTDETQLEALALRLVPIYGPNGETDRSKARLLPGELPDGLEIPLLPETAVIGSFLDGYGGTQIVLDVERPVADILAFYEEAFMNGDWQKAPEPSHNSGFTSSEMGQTYCHATSKETLWLMAMEAENGPTEVQLSIRPEEPYSACNPDAYSTGSQGAYTMIPALRDPNGVRQTSSGMGGSDNEANAYVYLSGALDLQEAIDHYAAQLENLDWTQTSETKTDSLIVTSWTFQDDNGEDWVGMLSAYQWPEAGDSLSVQLQILQAPN
ncbi:MAG: hypothetical protein IAF02_17235 [Anaerolineae bacterium]|nr:hypothetical protein [Anaerolineae bacterium]